MRQIDNYTDKEREILALKGMTAPRTASERKKIAQEHFNDREPVISGKFLLSEIKTEKTVNWSKAFCPVCQPIVDGHFRKREREMLSEIARLQTQLDKATGNVPQTTEPKPAPNKAQHSPLPWAWNEMATVIASDNTCTASVLHRDWQPATPPETAKANARLIVRAVNGYDKALQALRDLTKEIKLGTLNIRKDYNLIAAHAAAIKVLHESEAQ